MTRTSIILLSAAAAFAVAAFAADWVGSGWQRPVRIQLFWQGHPSVELEDAGLHPQRIWTHEMTASLIRENGVYIGWVDMAGEVHLGMATPSRSDRRGFGLQFVAPTAEIGAGVVSAALALAALVQFVLRQRTPARGFAIRPAVNPIAHHP